MAMSLAALLVALTPAWGIQPPRESRPGWPPSPALEIQPEDILVPQDELSQQTLRAGHAGLAALRRRHPAWQATIDPRTGSVDRAVGDGLPIETLPDPETTARRFMEDHAGLFAADLDRNGLELRLDDDASRPLGESGARLLRLDLFKDDLPVIGAGVSLGIRDGNVVLISTRALGPVPISTQPRLDQQQALASVESLAGMTLALQKESSLAIYPVARFRGATPILRHHLIYVLRVLPPETPAYETWVAWVDAHDGRVLAFFPEARHATCQSDPSQIRGRVVGGVRPNRADDAEVIREMPFALVNVNGTLVTSDLNGRFPWPGGTLTSTLAGTYFEAHCDNCTTPVEPSATGTPSGLVDFGTTGSSGPVPVFGNGTSTPADRTAFHHLQNTRFFLGKWDNALFDEIEVFVNIGNTCNAFSASAMLGFFVAGGNCRNSGEIRDVVSHELGHTWDRYDGNDITNGAMSEWKGDLLSLAIGGDGCVGESFRVTGGPTTACSGVRDMDEAAAGRTDHPLTPAVCPTCATLTIASNNCGSGSHCLGEIAGQMSVHLLGNLLTGADDITGVPFAAGNPALAPEQARWIFERLLVAGGPPMQVMNPASAGVSIYDAVALIDDEDGNLANGTPHAAYYNTAFTHHGLAESVLVADAAACAPLSDPLVTVTPDRDVATGLAAARIEWTPVGGATTFDVYRNTRAGDAFLPLARNVSAGPIFDVGVRPGGTYRYLVAAVRRTGCAEMSPGSNVASVTMSDPDLRIQSVTLMEVGGASDGDGMVEPGEQADVAVTLRETTGLAPASGVTATLSGQNPFAPIVTAGTVSFPTVPAGGTAAGTSFFRVLMGPSLGCGGRAHFTLSIKGSQGCWLDGFDALVSSAGGCAPSLTAFVEVVPGSVVVTGPGTGDADGIPDNCEAATVSYQVRNAGNAAVTPAGAVVSSPDPDITFSPSPTTCSIPSLNPGAVAGCQATLSLGGASSQGTIPLTITASGTGTVLSVTSVKVPVEANPPVYTTQTWNFEGSFQDWTAREFDLSTVRAATGVSSAHSGSTSRSNICGKLTSPALLLKPAVTSTLSFQLHATIEPFDSVSTNLWYDRANVHVIDLATAVHTPLVPSSGTAYNAFGNEQGGLCHNTNEAGWAGLLGGFSTVQFDLTPWAGKLVRVEINYGTDEGDNREGIYVDDVSVTNAALGGAPVDAQPDTCVVPEVSAPAAPVPLHVTRTAGDQYDMTWQDLGPGFQYNLYAGQLGTFYSHGAGQVSCSGVGSGTACASGSCLRSVPGGSLPAGNLYFVVTGTAFGFEGTAGFASAGPERNPAQNTCAP